MAPKKYGCNSAVPVIPKNREKHLKLGKTGLVHQMQFMPDFGVKFFDRSFFLSPRNNFGTTIGQGFRNPRCSISRCVPETTLDFSHMIRDTIVFLVGTSLSSESLGHTIQIQVNISRSVEKEANLSEATSCTKVATLHLLFSVSHLSAFWQETMTQSWSATRPKKRLREAKQQMAPGRWPRRPPHSWKKM